MKHSVQLFLAIQCCIAINRSIAMELELHKEKNAKVLTEITCIKDPFTAHYLTENRVLINGRDQCNIVDPASNKDVRKIFDNIKYSSCIAMHPNKTKFALAGYYYPPNSAAIQKITIHNAQTYEIEHTIDWATINGNHIETMLFSPLDDTIAINTRQKPDVILYNYITNKTTTINIPEATEEHLGYYSPIASFHPTQPYINLAWQTVYIHDLQTSTQKALTKTPQDHNFCEYSPDGSFIATCSVYRISCIKPGQLPHLTLIPRMQSNFDGDETDCFCGMAIHPNGKILMTFSTTLYRRSKGSHIVVDYHDINTSQLITKRILPLIYDGDLYPSFSPSGTKFIITTNNMCIELKVPFKVLCQDITKEKFLYLLFLLKNYTHSCADVEMPQDIYLLMRESLLETYKRR